MTSYRDDPAFTEVWNAHHRRMLDLAFRILFDLRESEDVVQEAFTRLARTGIERIEDPEGWLVVVTTRLCLDRFRARRRRPTDPLDVGADPYDPHAVDPSSQVTLVDNVTLAMHALLERLSPAERTSFVLHDVFQYTFEDIADDRRANSRRVPAAGQPRAPYPARGIGGRPLPRRLRAATRGQRAIHRGVHGWRSRRAAGVARPNRRRRG